MSLSPNEIAELLQPYTASGATPSPDWPRIYQQLAIYLDLLLKWNARLNLTAIRSPEEIVRRHFGESLFVALHLDCSTWNNPAPSTSIRPVSSPGASGSLLDFGSGAGFPGLPIQILWPELAVTLAESRQKKASFLREVVRSLGPRTEVWADRVENMPADRQFAVVTMRAVDEMEAAVSSAAVRAGQQLLILGARGSAYPSLVESFSGPELTSIPGSADGALMAFRRTKPL